MNGIHKGNNRLLAEYGGRSMTSCILKMLHFPFFFFLSSFLSYMCAYAISFLFLFRGAIYTYLCIFLCVCIIKRPSSWYPIAFRKKKKKKEKVVRKTQRNGRWNTRQTRDIYMRMMMARACLYCCYATKHSTLCIFTLIGSGVDERIRYRVRLTTALQQPLPTNCTDFHLHTFDGACNATICALHSDVYFPVKMLTHKVHTVKFLSAIIWSPGKKYIWRFGLAINNYKCVSLHICNWQPDREREESLKKKNTQKNI